MAVSKNRGTPKWMVYNGKPYLELLKMDDLGGKTYYFRKHPHNPNLQNDCPNPFFQSPSHVFQSPREVRCYFGAPQTHTSWGSAFRGVLSHLTVRYDWRIPTNSEKTREIRHLGAFFTTHWKQPLLHSQVQKEFALLVMFFCYCLHHGKTHLW